VLDHAYDFLDASGLDAQFFQARQIVCRDIEGIALKTR